MKKYQYAILIVLVFVLGLTSRDWVRPIKTHAAIQMPVAFDMGFFFDRDGKAIPEAVGTAKVMYSRFVTLMISTKDFYSLASKKLTDNDIPFDHLVVRCGSDTAEEHALKDEWLNNHKLPGGSILLAFERAQSLACVWERHNVPCVYMYDKDPKSYGPSLLRQHGTPGYTLG